MESSDNAELRRELGGAMARMANADALPYFGRLMAGDMKHDAGTVFEGLLTMVQQGRAADQALTILLDGLRIPTPRRAAGRSSDCGRSRMPAWLPPSSRG